MVCVCDHMHVYAVRHYDLHIAPFAHRHLSGFTGKLATHTVQPASDATGPSLLLMAPPALNSAISTPLKLHKQTLQLLNMEVAAVLLIT